MDKAALPRRSWRLSTQVLVLQLLIIGMTVGAGFAVSFGQARARLDELVGERSLAIANTVASTSTIIDALADSTSAAAIDPIVEKIRIRTGAAFIVVASDDGVRYSHPNPAMIGTSLMQDRGENPAAVLAGHTYVGVQSGSLGRSMRAKVPIRDATGRVIGLVSVGILEDSVSSQFVAEFPVALVPPALGLLLGAVGALMLARRIKRQTFGLEPNEIGTLLEQREAMLHGIREGAMTVDHAGRLTLLNDEAQRLLGLDRSALARPLADSLPEGRVRDVLTGRIDGLDESVLVNDHVLLVNRMPVELHGRSIGAVVTLRDRTELETLVRELDDLRSLADALRAKEHEFANRMHVLGGLIELKRYDDAIQFINMNSLLHQELAAALVERVGEPLISALLLGKVSVASERGIDLQITAELDVQDVHEPRGLVTVVGNLIDNALESAGSGGRVDVFIAAEGADLVIRVHDSGPGIENHLITEIFRDGYTTKVAQDGLRRRGLGLALVSQEVRRRGGEIRVDNVDGALITVLVPRHAAAGLLPT